MLSSATHVPAISTYAHPQVVTQLTCAVATFDQFITFQELILSRPLQTKPTNISILRLCHVNPNSCMTHQSVECIMLTSFPKWLNSDTKTKYTNNSNQVSTLTCIRTLRVRYMLEKSIQITTEKRKPITWCAMGASVDCVSKTRFSYGARRYKKG